MEYDWSISSVWYLSSENQMDKINQKDQINETDRYLLPVKGARFFQPRRLKKVGPLFTKCLIRR